MYILYLTKQWRDAKSNCSAGELWVLKANQFISTDPEIKRKLRVPFGSIIKIDYKFGLDFYLNWFTVQIYFNMWVFRMK